MSTPSSGSGLLGLSDLFGGNLTGLAGILSNLFSDSTTNASGSTNSTSNQSGTSAGSTSKTLTPYQTALQSPLFGLVNNLMTNPAQFTAPFRQQALDQTNTTYSGLADSLRQQFMTTGGGSTGKFGTALATGDLQRLGALQGVNTQFDQTDATLPLEAESLGQNLLGMNFGSTTTGATSATGSTAGATSSTSNTTGIKL